MPLLQKHAIKLQEQLHLEVLIALIVDKNEENHVQRMGRDIAAITPDPKYYANVPRDYDRVERNRQKRVELDGMDMSELMCEVCVPGSAACLLCVVPSEAYHRSRFCKTHMQYRPTC